MVKEELGNCAYRYSEGEGLWVKDMVGGIFCRFRVKRGEE
jgi:hypothetical protein